MHFLSLLSLCVRVINYLFSHLLDLSKVFSEKEKRKERFISFSTCNFHRIFARTVQIDRSKIDTQSGTREANERRITNREK